MRTWGFAKPATTSAPVLRQSFIHFCIVTII